MAYGFALRYSILLIVLIGCGWYGVRIAGPNVKCRALGGIMGFVLGPFGLFLFSFITLIAGLFPSPRLAVGWVKHHPQPSALRVPRHIIHGRCSKQESDE